MGAALASSLSPAMRSTARLDDQGGFCDGSVRTESCRAPAWASALSIRTRLDHLPSWRRRHAEHPQPDSGRRTTRLTAEPPHADRQGCGPAGAPGATGESRCLANHHRVPGSTRSPLSRLACRVAANSRRFVGQALQGWNWLTCRGTGQGNRILTGSGAEQFNATPHSATMRRTQHDAPQDDPERGLTCGRSLECDCPGNGVIIATGRGRLDLASQALFLPEPHCGPCASLFG